MILRLFALFCFIVSIISGELHGKVPQQANRPNEKATRVTITDDATMEIYQVFFFYHSLGFYT